MSILYQVCRYFIFILLLALLTPAASQTDISARVLGNGGENAQNTSYILKGTVGQGTIGTTGNASHLSKGGFWYQVGDILTAIEQLDDQLPDKFRLEQNFPNPFNPSTTIRFAVPKAVNVTLQIFDMLGRKVTTLAEEEMQPGVYKMIVDGRELPSGVYFYRIRAGEFVQTRKMLLVK